MTESAVLSEGIRLRGRVHGEGDLLIDGEVEGDVSVTGELALGETARVAGSVEADAVVVAGSVEGDVNAAGAVSVTGSGQLEGNVSAAEFSLEEGARFSGRVDVKFDLPDAIA